MSFLLDFLFPKTCVSCGKWGTYICINCHNKIKFQMEGKKTEDTDGVISIMKYSGIAKSIIKKVKYTLAFAILEDFFKLLPEDALYTLQNFIKDNAIDLLQPIPLYKTRENIRGFNQSQRIAQYIYQKTQVPVINSLLRVKNTTPQAQILDKQKRKENIKDAFVVINKETIQGKNIALVDDLITSGSTANEAARVLKQNGAHSVFVLTLAH